MTLSLDDVRNKRFRMARKSGYEVLEVDEFVDEVEATVEQLFEENENLKKQVEALKSTGSATAESGAEDQPTQTRATSDAAASRPEQPTERIVVTTGKEASSAVVRLVELSTQQSEQLVNEAAAEAAQIREQAAASADQVTTEAKSRAERFESDARTHAERLQADALGRAESLDREIATRRTEMFGTLEKQRDELTSTVRALRGFESNYRTNLTRHLQNQIQVLASTHEEPADAPAAVDEAPGSHRSAGSQTARANGPAASGSTQARQAEDDSPTAGGGSATSDTPRLDALLGDQR